MRKLLNMVFWSLLGYSFFHTFAEVPHWWLEKEIIVPEHSAHDFYPANQGQAKWIAVKAYEEFEKQLPGDANTNILNQIIDFPEGNNYRPVNIGMLKNLASSFYVRLIEEGYIADFPWSGKFSDDYALANQGQLKNLFYFDFDRHVFTVDSDGDGLSDALELYGKVYQVIPGNFIWEEAKIDAERLGGRLAVITSEKEHSILFQFIGFREFFDKNLWIGAEDIDGDGQWHWVTGESLEYTRWAEGRPQKEAGRAAMYNVSTTRTGEGQIWTDSGKNIRGSYIIEYSAQLDPLQSDTDGDGVNDFDEIRLSGNPTKIDTDGNGIPDGEELTQGTSLAHQDSDFDGLSDIEELALGTNPLNPDTDGDGVLDGVEAYGKLYYPVFEMLTWHEAKAHAESLGGHLATVTSEKEHQNIVRSIGHTLLSRYNFWLGGTDEELEGQWRWITGEPFTYSRWRQDSSFDAPDNLNGGEDHLEYSKSSGYLYGWNDAKGTLYRPYIIEIDVALDPFNPDSDGDGIPDGEEISRGMNPLSPDSCKDGLGDAFKLSLGLNPALIDSDFDGLSDAAELLLGTNPLNPDTDGDGLLDGEEVYITKTNPLSPFDAAPDAVRIAKLPGSQTVGRSYPHNTTEYIEDGDDLIITSLSWNPQVMWQYTNSAANMYRLAIQLEPYEKEQFEYYRYPVEVSINGYYIGTMLAVTNRGDLPEGIIYTPWLEPGVYEITCRFIQHMPPGITDVRIHALEVYAINGTNTNASGFDDWVYERLSSGMDSDGDGLSDIDEIRIYGTDPLNVDSDGDGLSDAEEIAMGTDPLQRDSDGDGVDDWTEMHQALTDPLHSDFGTRIDVMSANGSAITASAGNWIAEGTVIYSVGLNGSLTYVLNVPADGHYAVEFEIADRSYHPVQKPFELTLAVNGISGRPVSTLVPKGESETVMFFAPFMTAGMHTAELIWNNLNSSLMLEVRSIRLITFEGTDWIDGREANSLTIKDRTSSPVSPVCMEGSSLFMDLFSISNSFALVNSSNHWAEVKKSIRQGWYADAVLAPYQQTDLTLTHNTTRTETISVEWEETNLMNMSTNQVTIRKGDALLFNALPQNAKQGSIIITVTDPSGSSTNLISLTEKPVPHMFEEAGVYAVSGFFSKSRAVHFDNNVPTNVYGFCNGRASNGVFNGGNTSTSDLLIVNVVDYQFNGDPSCVKGSERFWNCPAIPAEAVVEQDANLEIARHPLDGGGTRFWMRSSTGAEQYMIARLIEDGPITDHSTINTITGAYGEYYRIIERFSDGSNLIELVITLDNIPDDIQIVVEIYSGGLTFLDGTIIKTFTKSDFNAQGVLKLQMVQPDGKENDCHRVKIFQNGEQIQ